MPEQGQVDQVAELFLASRPGREPVAASTTIPAEIATHAPTRCTCTCMHACIDKKAHAVKRARTHRTHTQTKTQAQNTNENASKKAFFSQSNRKQTLTYFLLRPAYATLRAFANERLAHTLTHPSLREAYAPLRALALSRCTLRAAPYAHVTRPYANLRHSNTQI